MSTRYIWVGGRPNKAPDGGKAFCEELTMGFTEPVKILDCLFTRPKDNWEQAFEQDQDFFSNNLPGKKLEFKLAQLENFSEQIKWADTIYIRGGSAEEYVVDLFRKNILWLGELDGKTLVGSSAGADLMSKSYYDLDALKLREGLGLLPYKVLVHWKSDYNAPNIDWDKAYEELKNYKDDLPIITLREGEYKVFE